MIRLSILLLLCSFLFIQCNGATASEGALVSGGTETGADLTPVIKDAAVTSGASVTVTGCTVSGTTVTGCTVTGTPVVAIDAGYASDGSAISFPTGFTAAQCKLTAAAAVIEGAAISTTVSVNQTTGVVTCKTLIQERSEVPATTKGCVASYTQLCTK